MAGSMLIFSCGCRLLGRQLHCRPVQNMRFAVLCVQDYIVGAFTASHDDSWVGAGEVRFDAFFIRNVRLFCIAETSSLGPLMMHVDSLPVDVLGLVANRLNSASIGRLYQQDGLKGWRVPTVEFDSQHYSFDPEHCSIHRHVYSFSSFQYRGSRQNVGTRALD